MHHTEKRLCNTIAARLCNTIAARVIWYQLLGLDATIKV